MHTPHTWGGICFPSGCPQPRALHSPQPVPILTQALLETALTRVVLPMPILVLPPIVMSMLEKTALLQARPRLLLPVHSLVCLAAFGLALPLAISLFPQMSEIETSQLEPEIARATSSRTVVYNKGL